jgi:hypothetical protein
MKFKYEDEIFHNVFFERGMYGTNKHDMEYIIDARYTKIYRTSTRALYILSK